MLGPTRLKRSPLDSPDVLGNGLRRKGGGVDASCGAVVELRFAGLQRGGSGGVRLRPIGGILTGEGVAPHGVDAAVAANAMLAS